LAIGARGVMRQTSLN